MAYEAKAGDGVLFQNSYKTAGDKKPDFKGNILDLNGKKFELAAWIKTGPKGDFFSLKMSEVMVKDACKANASTVNPTPNHDGGLPF